MIYKNQLCPGNVFLRKNDGIARHEEYMFIINVTIFGDKCYSLVNLNEGYVFHPWSTKDEILSYLNSIPIVAYKLQGG